MMRRKGDTQNLVLLVIGTILIVAGITLKVVASASDVLVIALVLIGGAMLPGNHIIDLVRAWRGRSEAEGPPAPPPDDGISP